VLPTVAGEWSLYFHANHLSHNELEARLDECRPGLVRGVIREDGFTSLTADGHGQCWTIPFKFDSYRIRLNFRTRYSGYVRCEVIPTPVIGGTGHSVSMGEPSPGFTLADSDPLTGDAVDQPLTWRGSPDLSRFRGQEVRLRFSLFKADMYALRF
jgi:hypothetical protein